MYRESPRVVGLPGSLSPVVLSSRSFVSCFQLVGVLSCHFLVFSEFCLEFPYLFLYFFSVVLWFMYFLVCFFYSCFFFI